MKKPLVALLPFAVTLLFASANWTDAREVEALDSKIDSVKLYQNQAKIERTVRLSLKKGENTVILGGLPSMLYDWSVKGGLPKGYSGKLLSVEVEKKALVKKRQKKILEIEKKLADLREKDLEYLDGLKNIRSQEQFLNSIVTFTDRTAARELATRIPQVRVWDDTLNYVAEKRSALMTRKRQIEKKREELGKEIQRWEFELSQIAGSSYFHNYQSLNKVILGNRAGLVVQNFESINDQYAKQQRLLKRPESGVDIEKRLILHIYSSKDSEVDFRFSYLIPGTYWQMQYDVRASAESGQINLLVFANIYQKTGEDWSTVNLFLSTGTPVNAISPPYVASWYLDVGRRHYVGDLMEGAAGMAPMKKSKARMKRAEEASKKEDEYMPKTEVSDKGPFVEIGIPMKQTIFSSAKYQKKYMLEYWLEGGKSVSFYYELIPQEFSNGFLKAKLTNSTKIPWLNGESQVFLEGEFMGKSEMPYLPIGKKGELVLGTESRLTAVKELVKKYEDASGLFGGNRRISYKYKITVENQLPNRTKVFVTDILPVSRNEKIQVEIKNLSDRFLEDDETKKSSDFGRGIRKWELTIAPHQKKEIFYEVVITFDKETQIRGLR